MDSLVVQTGIRHGRVAELTRSQGGRLSIGRGYDNDLVLTDVHIAPRQIELYREDDQWHMRLLDDINPVLLNDRKVSGASAPVNSGDTITIGRTRLSVYAADHAVERTRKLMLSNWLARDSGSLLVPILVLLAVCLFDFLLSFYEASTTLKWEEFAFGELFSAVLIVLWAGLWSLAGRIFRHQSNFGLQLMATVAVFVLSSLLGLFGSYLGYAFHSPAVSEAIDWVLFFVVLMLLFRLNLLIATSIRNTAMVSAVTSGIVVAVTYGFVLFSETDEIQYEPVYSSIVKPPMFNMGSGEPVDDYFLRLGEKVQSELER